MSETTFSYYTKQLSFDYSNDRAATHASYQNVLIGLLSDDLDFHNHSSRYATHNFHAFPAKFPPQLPAKFILSLTDESEVVLNPMMGSGTTIVEAFLAGRKAIGFDIDPLAAKIAKVKTDHLEIKELMKFFKSILNRAKARVKDKNGNLKNEFSSRWDTNTRQFIDYWFTDETQVELMALLSEIFEIQDEKIRAFFEVALSATIITKSGGVSLALDLAHTRPHKAKIVLDKNGKAIFGEELYRENSSRLRHHTKKLLSAFDEFEKRSFQNMKGLLKSAPGKIEPDIRFGNAQDLPLEDGSVDLIVTSPPYASNAIDYMRAHKFSLIWLGYSIDSLGKKRKEYSGKNTLVVKRQ